MPTSWFPKRESSWIRHLRFLAFLKPQKTTNIGRKGIKTNNRRKTWSRNIKYCTINLKKSHLNPKKFLRNSLEWRVPKNGEGTKLLPLNSETIKVLGTKGQGYIVRPKMFPLRSSKWPDDVTWHWNYVIIFKNGSHLRSTILDFSISKHFEKTARLSKYDCYGIIRFHEQ